jgi:hypothetical protein
MARIQREIVRVLRAANGDLSMTELVARVDSASGIEVRAALLPMISSELIELGSDRKLRLRAE